MKWTAVWPTLAALSPEPLRLLDAGCGEGDWAAEIAARRPRWRVVGIDSVDERVSRAVQRARRVSIPNLRFEVADFLEYRPEEPFDVVLSVSAAHYLLQRGCGAALFRRFHDWLAPGGRLVLYGPRRREDVPALGALPDPFVMRPVIAAEELASLCACAGLEVETLAAVNRRAGTIARQLARLAGSSVAARVVAYPLEMALLALDRAAGAAPAAAARSSGLLLVARRPPRPTAPNARGAAGD